MQVCISANSEYPDAQMDAKFGRCQYLLFIDTDTMKVESFPNAYKDAQSGAGTQVAQEVISRNPDALITGHVGPHAAELLKSSRIPVYSAEEVTVRTAIDDLLNDRLKQQDL